MHEQVVMTSKAVLVVEDSAAQCELLSQALAEHGFDSDIHIEQGVAAAFSYLHHQVEHHTVLPRLILVDLKLTNGSGLDIVHYIRHHDRLHLIPVIILTSSDAHADIQTSYRAGPTPMSSSREPIRSSSCSRATSAGFGWIGIGLPECSRKPH